MTTRQIVMQLVQEQPGIKATKLVVDVITLLKDDFEELESFDPIKIFEIMAIDGDILEIEYVLPGTDRVKSLFFPKGTEFTYPVKYMAAE